MVADRDILTVALPKGTLYHNSVKLLGLAGLDTEFVQDPGRQLLLYSVKDAVRFIICRPTDIPTYVEYGAADLGLVGKDTIVEQQKDVYELLDLKFGGCRFMVAVPEGAEQDLHKWNQARVATKFPRIAEAFFRQQGMQMEIIKLHGNIELAPIVGLAEMIVDLVSTGRTLRENKLVPVAEVLNSTTRLIANRVSHRLKNERINPLVEKIRQVVEEGKLEA
ncbi:ATP phosphoribosyltransferase [Desulfotomaculum nigrificans CO-1-SRB]|uniref:ATP phosphoribosyltransferase n=1 Tax=Desulfotomaculum nigrificans (strain DSM 14880 / VKM B-2319 / CO-1-SRB) TaxID=868595 RepID=F6B7V8_DESCC|nr:ATP phosphoribosyltransferase [Desulfotomaculum nigrificans]AEF94595.1 ATP phosphoribosyltransferase [Desulfotomaculum nigrificans CO-1-SRB]